MKCLVTAIGSMSAEAVIQALRYQPAVEVIGCNMHPSEWTATSRLVERFHLVPPASDEIAYISKLLDICQVEEISHLIPLTDPEVDVLSANMQIFSDVGVCVCISPRGAIQTARDKLAVYQCFSNHPRIHAIPTADFQSDKCDGFTYPMLAKPRRGRSSEGHVHIADADALQFWRGRLAGQEYVVQPLCTGAVFVVDIVRQADGSGSVAMTRQELLRTYNGAGMTVKMRPENLCESLAKEAADVIGLCGCVNMEFLVDGDLPLLMDVNPRFSAGVGFSLMSGYDMVSNHLRCFDGRALDPCRPPLERVYTRGYIDYLLQD